MDLVKADRFVYLEYSITYFSLNVNRFWEILQNVHILHTVGTKRRSFPEDACFFGKIRENRRSIVRISA